MRTNRLKNGQIRHFSVCRPCFTPVKLRPSHRKAHEFFSFSGAEQFWAQENFSQTKPQNKGIPAYSEALRQSIRKILPPKTDLSLSPLTHVLYLYHIYAALSSNSRLKWGAMRVFEKISICGEHLWRGYNWSVCGNNNSADWTDKRKQRRENEKNREKCRPGVDFSEHIW